MDKMKEKILNIFDIHLVAPSEDTGFILEDDFSVIADDIVALVESMPEKGV